MFQQESIPNKNKVLIVMATNYEVKRNHRITSHQ
jgi:hypothetical protein